MVVYLWSQQSCKLKQLHVLKHFQCLLLVGLDTRTFTEFRNQLLWMYQLGNVALIPRRDEC